MEIKINNICTRGEEFYLESHFGENLVELMLNNFEQIEIPIKRL